MEELNTVFLDLVFKCHEKQTKKALHKHTFTVAHLPGCFPAAAGSCASHSSPLQNFFSLLHHFKTLSDTSTPAASLLLHSPHIRLQFPPFLCLSLLLGSVCRHIHLMLFLFLSAASDQLTHLSTLRLSPGQLTEVWVFMYLCLALSRSFAWFESTWSLVPLCLRENI